MHGFLCDLNYELLVFYNNEIFLERIQSYFQQSFNRGIKLSDIKMRHLEHLFEDAFKNGNMDMVDSYPVKSKISFLLPTEIVRKIILKNKKI